MGFDLWSLVCGETKTLGEYVTEEAIHFIAAKKTEKELEIHSMEESCLLLFCKILTRKPSYKV